MEMTTYKNTYKISYERSLKYNGRRNRMALMQAKIMQENILKYSPDHTIPRSSDDLIARQQKQSEYIMSCEREYARAFCKYLGAQGSEEEKNMEEAFRRLETALYSEKSTNLGHDYNHSKPHSREERISAVEDMIVQFFVVLPEELRNDDAIEIGIVKFSSYIEDFLVLKRCGNGLFTGQYQVSTENFRYLYVIYFKSWSMLEWLGDGLMPRIYTQSSYVFDGSILCDPDCNQNDCRMRGLLSMLPNISHLPSPTSDADIVEWILAVCCQQLQLLKHVIITSSNHLYGNYQPGLLKHLEKEEASSFYSNRLFSTGFLCISQDNVGYNTLWMFHTAVELLRKLPIESTKPILNLLLLLVKDPAVRDFEVESGRKNVEEHPLTIYLTIVPNYLSKITDEAIPEKLEKASHEEMQYWKELFAIGIDQNNDASEWSALLDRKFKKRLGDLSDVNLVNFVYLYKEIPGESSMGKAVLESAFDRVFNDERIDMQQLRPNVFDLINHGLHDMKNTPEELLKQVLTWKNSHHVFEFCEPLKDSMDNTPITRRSWQNINRCQAAIKDLANRLLLREMNIKTFHFLFPEKDGGERAKLWYRLCTIQEDSERDIDDFSKMIEDRSTEYDLVQYFIGLLEHFWGYHKDYFKDGKVSKWIDNAKEGRLTFKQVIQPNCQDNLPPWLAVICEMIPEEVKLDLEAFKFFTKRDYSVNPMSETIYKEHLDRANPTRLIDLPNVFREADDAFKNWMKKFTDGSITIGELKAIFDKYFGGEEKALFDEIKDMLKQDEMQMQREEQVDIALHLEQYYRSADIIMKVKNDLAPNADFTEFSSIFHKVALSVLWY